MKRRLFALLLALALWAALPLSARADVIYTPDDTFYESHMESCNYVNRSYTANGPGGSLTLYTSPENNHAEGIVANGKPVYVSVTYTGADGITWGCAELWEENITGWVPMDYLVPIYNFQSFAEEFSHRFVDEEGNLDAWAGQEIIAWSYPGSDSGDVLPVDPEYSPEYDTVFVDDAGKKWVYCGYYYGSRNFWVCLDSPTADYETLYADSAPQQVTHYDITEPEEVIAPDGISPAVVIGAAAAVAAVSAAILVVMKKRK